MDEYKEWRAIPLVLLCFMVNIFDKSVNKMYTSVMDFKKVFKSIGFSPEEAEILGILYKDGNLKVSEISSKISIPRTSIYAHLKSLERGGYIAQSKKGKISSFVPKNPEQILENLDTAASQFSEILPLLLRITEHHGKRPKINFYESQFGIETIYKDMIRCARSKEIVRIIESAETTKENLERLSNRFMLAWQKKMIEKNIITQGIIIGDAQTIFAGLSQQLKNVLRRRASTVRLQSSANFPFSINLYLVGSDKVYICVPQKEFVMKIESEEVHQSLLIMYRLMYDAAKPIQLSELLR